MKLDSLTPAQQAMVYSFVISADLPEPIVSEILDNMGYTPEHLKVLDQDLAVVDAFIEIDLMLAAQAFAGKQTNG